MSALIRFFVVIFIGTFTVVGIILLVDSIKNISKYKQNYVDEGLHTFHLVNIYSTETNIPTSNNHLFEKKVTYYAEYESENQQFHFKKTSNSKISDSNTNEEIKMRVIKNNTNAKLYEVLDPDVNIDVYLKTIYKESIQKAITGGILALVGILILILLFKKR